MRRLAWVLVALLAPPASAETTLLVYLPSSPVESAGRLGEAVTELGAYLSGRVPGLTLTVRPFRKGEDARAFVQASGGEVALLLSEGPFLLDLPPGFSPVPLCRVVRSGGETHRKLVVVGSANPSVKSLVDLKGRSLSLAVSGGDGTSRFLARVIFDGGIVPEAWFGKMVAEPDEFTAAADVIYGRADAALVSDDNPFVAGHLGKELRAVYTSPAVTLPVLSVRSAVLRPEQQAALETALLGLSRQPEGKKILEGMRVDGFAKIEGGARAALLSLPADERRLPEVATVVGRDWTLPPLPRPDGSKLPFLLGFAVPELPSLAVEAAKGGTP